MMAKARKIRLQVPRDDLEWLYVPDVTYAAYEHGGPRRLQMIIPYRPSWPAEERYPLLLFLPGSAWYRQEMYNNLPSLAELARRGMVVAEMQYRESTIAPFPAQAEDVSAAVRFLRGRAEEFHLDPDQIFLGGNSSGGHIALLAGLGGAALGADCGPVRGIVALSAPTDLTADLEAPPPPGEPSPRADLLGVRSAWDAPELAARASCKHWLWPGVPLPPVLLFHGAEDDLVPARHSRDLFERLSKLGGEVEYCELPGAGHGGAAFWSAPVLDRIAKFVRWQSGSF